MTHLYNKLLRVCTESEDLKRQVMLKSEKKKTIGTKYDSKIIY